MHNQENSSRQSKNGRCSVCNKNTEASNNSRGRSDFVGENELNLDTHDSCDGRKYDDILNRFHCLRERMSKSPKKGDRLFEKNSCTILEELSENICPLPHNGRADQRETNCSQNTEEITITKVNGQNGDYVKQTLIERSTITREGVLTTMRHVMEKRNRNHTLDLPKACVQTTSPGLNRSKFPKKRLSKSVPPHTSYRLGSTERVANTNEMIPSQSEKSTDENFSSPPFRTIKEANFLPKCCSCIRQLYKRHVAQLLSLPENELDPQTLSKLLIEDSNGQVRIDYFLVGELLRNQSIQAVNVCNESKEASNDISSADCHESEYVPLDKRDSSLVYCSKKLKDDVCISCQTYTIPYQSDNQDSGSSLLHDIVSPNSRRESFGERPSKKLNPSFPRTEANVPEQCEDVPLVCGCCDAQKCCPLICAIKINDPEQTGLPSSNAQSNKEDPYQLSHRETLDFKRRHRSSSGQEQCQCCEEEVKNFCSVIQGYCNKKFHSDVTPNEKRRTLSESDQENTKKPKSTTETPKKQSELLKEIVICNDFGCSAPVCIDKGIQVHCCEPSSEKELRYNNYEVSDEAEVSHDRHNTIEYNGDGQKSSICDEECECLLEYSLTDQQRRNYSFEPREGCSQNIKNRGEKSQNIRDEVLMKKIACFDENFACDEQQEEDNSYAPRESFVQNNESCIPNDQHYDISNELSADGCEKPRDDSTIEGQQHKKTTDEFNGKFEENPLKQNNQLPNYNQNTTDNQQIVQPIVIPIMCYLPPSCMCRACNPFCNPQPCGTVNVSPCNLQGYCPCPPNENSCSCQCCGPQSCYSPQICSPTCFPQQSYDPSFSRESQFQYCCLPPPHGGTTSSVCCDPPTCCCIPCYDPQPNCLTLQIGKSAHTDKHTHRSRGKKSTDRRRTNE